MESRLQLFFLIKRTFDKLWIKGLVYKCVAFDSPNLMVLVIHNFLEGRWMLQCQDKSLLSDRKQISARVPQGSILGPTLLNIYMVDLKVKQPMMLAFYANDATMYMQHTRSIYTIQKLQKTIIEMESWDKKWQLQVNASTT